MNEYIEGFKILTEEDKDLFRERLLNDSNKNKEFYYEFLLYLLKEKYTTVELYYVDRGDNISASTYNNELKGISDLGDILDYWNINEMFDYIYKEVFTGNEIKYIFDNNIQNNFEDYLYSIDKSNPINDLLNNTNSMQLYYYTGIDVGDTSEDLMNKLKELGVQFKKFDQSKSFSSLSEWNFYGGELQILFKPDPADIIKDINKLDSSIQYYIEFSDPVIGLSDTSQGSGGYSTFSGTIRLPFDRKNIYVSSEGPGYDLTQVYGDNDLGDCSYAFKKSKKKLEINIDPKAEQYSKWDSDLKKGICHIEDPRFNSHDTVYINDYPCGNHCKRCGKFYID